MRRLSTQARVPRAPVTDDAQRRLWPHLVQLLTQVTLYLDTARVPGWNEIDAVCLCDVDGRFHGAELAAAPSTLMATQPASREAP